MLLKLDSNDLSRDRNGQIILGPPNKPMLVLVHGSFCHHCRDFLPVYTQASNQYGKVKFAEIQIDAMQPNIKALADYLPNILGQKIQGVPLLVAFKNGRPYQTYSDKRTVESLIRFAKSVEN